MPPLYSVEYQSKRGPACFCDHTDWVCPAGYTEQQAREAFQTRYPDATVLDIHLVPTDA